MITAGTYYRHYKGTVYKVLHIAHDSDTEETVVVYQDTTAPEKVWTRTLKVFEEDVEVEGKRMPRFAPVEDIQ